MANGVSGREIQSTDGQIIQGVGGVEISAGGDQISGKWFDPSSGMEVNVLRTIDTGDGLSIVTDKGVLSGQQFSRFIQMDVNQSSAIMSIPNNVPQNINMDSLSDEDKMLINQASGQKRISLDHPITNQPQFIAQQQNISQSNESTNYKIIDKLFKKFEDKSPEVKVNIQWGDFPKEQLSTLIDIFDVPKEEIAEYIVNKFLSSDNIKEIVSEMI